MRVQFAVLVPPLAPEDRFRVVVFSSRARELTRGWQLVDEESVEAVRRQLLALGVEGGTNLYSGLKTGLDKLDGDRTSAVILVSDGGANEGPTEHRAFRRDNFHELLFQYADVFFARIAYWFTGPSCKG